jgi:hypothetical protein
LKPGGFDHLKRYGSSIEFNLKRYGSSIEFNALPTEGTNVQKLVHAPL